jgi:Pectate lyase superfamily protein
MGGGFGNCVPAALCVLLSACGAGSELTAVERISASEVPSRGSTFEFSTTAQVDVRDFGARGDGITRDTLAFQQALGAGDRTVKVPAGDYLISKLEIPSNTILILEPGVTLRDSGELSEIECLINIRGENVRIIGQGARVIADRSDYTTGEFRHGVLIFGARNVDIAGLESSGHGGDGFYIGGRAKPSTDISITGCSADNNRRQGLSIVSGVKVFVADCELSNTRGTAPEAGIDLEPNGPQDSLQDVVIVRPQTQRNAGGGIIVFLPAFGSGGRPATITIVDHMSSRERTDFRQSGLRPVDRVRYVTTQ